MSTLAINQKASILYLVWAGIAIGVSFIATPVKFMAPDLSMEHALQVGRVTFRAMGMVEVALLALLFVTVVSKKSFARHDLIWPFVLCGLVTAQYGLLLPKLAAHTDQFVSAGAQADPSSMHICYIVVELLKVVILIVLGSRITTFSSRMETV